MHIKKWLLAAAGFPLAYIILPISCCVRNPAAKVYDDDNVVTRRDAGGKIIENIGVGLMGAIVTVSCCCCCDCTKEPKDM